MVPPGWKCRPTLPCDEPPAVVGADVSKEGVYLEVEGDDGISFFGRARVIDEINAPPMADSISPD
jgi:hypothetical protein